jgi:hypothetical protein
MRFLAKMKVFYKSVTLNPLLTVIKSLTTREKVKNLRQFVLQKSKQNRFSSTCTDKASSSLHTCMFLTQFSMGFIYLIIDSDLVLHRPSLLQCYPKAL